MKVEFLSKFSKDLDRINIKSISLPTESGLQITESAFSMKMEKSFSRELLTEKIFINYFRSLSTHWPLFFKRSH